MAVARDLLGNKNNVISVIGDGAMTAGQAYEAMNNAGYLDSNLIVILNDNKQVSLPTATLDGPATPVGALSSALTKLQASTQFRKLREAAKVIPLCLPVLLTSYSEFFCFCFFISFLDLIWLILCQRISQSKSVAKLIKLQQKLMNMQED